MDNILPWGIPTYIIDRTGSLIARRALKMVFFEMKESMEVDYVEFFNNVIN